MENTTIIYKGLKLGRDPISEVSEEELKQEINNLLQQRISYVEKENESVLGDTVNIDFEGFVDGVAFEGGKAEGYDLELGSGSFIPGFEEQLVGYKSGDDVDVNVTFPEEYHAENLKGKAAVFKCKIHSVKEKVTPEFNQDFAMSNGFNTIQELENAITQHIYSRKQGEANNAYIAKLCDHIVENATIEVEDELVDAKVNDMIKFYESNMAQYGITLENYVQMMGMDIEAFKLKLRDDAIKAVKIDLIYDYIATSEKFDVTEEEVKTELDLIKSYYGLTDEQVAQFEKERVAELKLDMLRQKVSRFLLENND